MALYIAKGSLKFSFFTVRFQFKKYTDKGNYKVFYNILEIPEGSDQELIRESYLDKVKRYHPDSGHPDANIIKFQQVDTAFRTLMNQPNAPPSIKPNEESDEDEEREIKHKPIQHRQYLSYDGVGVGNPFQREKQYNRHKASQALDNVANHEISKIDPQEKLPVPKKHKIRTTVHLGRFVEDLIQESISKGALKNLAGEGKPLKDRTPNPHVDFVTQKMNEILIENGYQPKWIMLHKEIRDDVNNLRKKLYTERTYFNPYPLSIEENIEWSNVIDKYKNSVSEINSKIETFNLIVPLWRKQLLTINLSKEAEKVLIEGKDKRHHKQTANFIKPKKHMERKSELKSSTFFDFLENILTRTK